MYPLISDFNSRTLEILVFSAKRKIRIVGLTLETGKATQLFISKLQCIDAMNEYLALSKTKNPK